MAAVESSRLRAIDLFCGAGGLTEGFRRAGYEVTFAVDFDGDACESYERNHGAVVHNDPITKFTPEDIERLSGGDVDVVIGGPSCQGFSTARKKRWDDPDSDRNLLWRHMLDVVGQLRPKAFLIENVPGLVQWKAGNFGGQILEEFKKLGYAVAEPTILLAADFGVPQRRRRLFIVGLLGDKEFEFPPVTHLGGWRRDTLELWEKKRQTLGLRRHISVWESLSDLPLLGSSPGVEQGQYASQAATPYQRMVRGDTKVLRDHVAPELGDIHRKLIEHVPQGGTWRDIPPYLLPDRFRGMRRTDSSNLVGRLHPELPAYTITTQFTNVTVGCFTHPYEDRALSVREAARLQSFRDSYRFVGSIGSRARQIGNAVPPLLATVLANAIADQIEVGREIHRVAAPVIKPVANMPAPPASDLTKARMKAQKRTDTQPEALLKAALADLGVQNFECDARPLEDLRRTADIVLREQRVAVLVHGCFWHGCPEHSRDTKSNTKWWREKIDKNMERDKDTIARFQAVGWRVVVVWEHEHPGPAARRVLDELDPGLAAFTGA